MAAIISLIFVLFLSLLIVRVATVALTLTGLSRQSAQFQARSAWTGTGFTTTESENVVKHPVRRKIINWLIFLRNAGLITAASTLVLSFVSVEQADQGLWRFLWLLVGLVLLWAVAGSRWLDHQLSRLIAGALKRYTTIDTRDYVDMLHLAGDYAVTDLGVRDGHWLAGKTLDKAGLPEEGVLVLGVTRPDGSYVGAPRGATRVQPGDELLLYGRSSELAKLDRRGADTGGERDRAEAVQEQQRVLEAQPDDG
jgi:hypothetical protein